MKIRTICQICGRMRVLDTEEKIGSEPRWEDYQLGHLLNPDEVYPFDAWNVWICANCHSDSIIGYYTNYDEDGVETLGVEYDWDGLNNQLKESLGLRTLEPKVIK